MSNVNLAELLEKGERQHLDVKGPMSFAGDHRLELAKDIIAMANTRDGGAIVIGVSEGEEGACWRSLRRA